MWPWRRREKALSLGARGEKIALRFLRRRGMKILGRNYRCPTGEIDLIVLDRSTRRCGGAETIVFVEVKTRSSDTYTDPQSAVDAEKQRRVRRVADYYLASRPVEGFNVRFDIVAIVIRPEEDPDIRYFPDAF